MLGTAAISLGCNPTFLMTPLGLLLMRPGKGGGGGRGIITNCPMFWSNWLSNFKYLDYYNCKY